MSWTTPKTNWAYNYDAYGNYVGDYFNLADAKRIADNIAAIRDLALQKLPSGIPYHVVSETMVHNYRDDQDVWRSDRYYRYSLLNSSSYPDFNVIPGSSFTYSLKSDAFCSQFIINLYYLFRLAEMSRGMVEGSWMINSYTNATDKLYFTGYAAEVNWLLNMDNALHTYSGAASYAGYIMQNTTSESAIVLRDIVAVREVRWSDPATHQWYSTQSVTPKLYDFSNQPFFSAVELNVIENQMNTVYARYQAM